MSPLQNPNTIAGTPETTNAAVPAGTDPLLMRNGAAVPLADVPQFSLSYFSHWIAAATRSGGRVSAFFALPVQPALVNPAMPPDGGKPDGEASGSAFRIFAVLSMDRESALLVASTEVRGGYPSLTPRVPQLHLFERELHEKHGILPEGHPWLKPVRFEKPGGPPVGVMDFYQVEGDEVHEVAVGPIHAGVIECGHFRFQCLGEVVMHLEISLGYHHRGVESLLRGSPHIRTLPLMETVAGDSTIAHTWAYCSILEALSDLDPSPRGQVIRALALELERLANHTGDLGAIAGDVGFLPTLSFCGRLRGDWLNMSAMLCGSRFGRGLLIPGGCAYDVDNTIVQSLADKVRQATRDTLGAVQLCWDSPSVMARLTGTGTVTAEDAAALGLVGPAARACGLERDVRHSHPLPGLPLAPDRALAGKGDVRSRAEVRSTEITASSAFCLRILTEFLDGEDWDFDSVNAGPFPSLTPDSLAVALVEGWRGELCHVGVTDQNGVFTAYSVTDPSFHNWMGLALALRGQQISDFPLCNKSFNLSYCGHDL